MVSLGREVYCGALKVREDLTVAGRINGDLTVDGSITAKSKLIGEANNLGELHHNGSVFYIKWSAVHQAASLTTVDASDEVTWATTAAHGLAQNDVVHVSAPPPNPTPITEVNGIPAAELTGTFTVQSATTNTFHFHRASCHRGHVCRQRHLHADNSPPSFGESGLLVCKGQSNPETFSAVSCPLYMYIQQAERIHTAPQANRSTVQ